MGGCLTPLQRCSQCILQPQLTGQLQFGPLAITPRWLPLSNTIEAYFAVYPLNFLQLVLPIKFQQKVLPIKFFLQLVLPIKFLHLVLTFYIIEYSLLKSFFAHKNKTTIYSTHQSYIYLQITSKHYVKKNPKKPSLNNVGNWLKFQASINRWKYGGSRGVMVIVVGNGHYDTSSNPGRDWSHFT